MVLSALNTVLLCVSAVGLLLVHGVLRFEQRLADLARQPFVVQTHIQRLVEEFMGLKVTILIEMLATQLVVALDLLACAQGATAVTALVAP